MRIGVGSAGATTGKLHGVRWPVAIALVALGLGCQISPTVAPDEGRRTSRYEDCKSAARAYCRDAVDTAEEDMKQCIAKAAFQCTSGGGDG
jgi:hypothetical protein